MRRVVAICATFALVFFGGPSPANAAPCPDATAVDGLGLVCIIADGDTAGINVIDPATGIVLVATSVPLPVPAPVTVTVPGPTITVPGPTQTITVAPPGGPATSTVTRTVPGPTATVTEEGATITESATPTTVTKTTTITSGRQAGRSSATMTQESTTPALAEPPSVPPGSFDLLPDTPAAAAATGSILGLIIGLLAAFALMFIAYRKGQEDGEKASIQDFLDYLRSPTPGRHRAE